MTLPDLRPKNRYWQVFWLCFAVAAVLFLPHCVIDAAAGGGYFHYAGDFNDQQINFYQYANGFVKDGGTFSWATDLGSGFVNSYSFYLTGSPFFWLSLLIPQKLMPWAMVPLLCLKFAVAGGGAYLWSRRWVGGEEWQMLAACLYAFSGFSVYNIFFNHFLDVVATFPYLLASLDDAVLDKKYGRFPFWVAVNLLNNYFFFAGQAVFLIIYFVCMLAGRRYRLTGRLFGRLAFETVLGCAMGCALLIPAMLSLAQNPRTIDPFEGYGYLVYGKAQQYLAILYSAFLMPDAPYLKDLFQEGILKHTSMTAWLPVVGVIGGIAFCRGRRRHPFSYILKTCIVCAFVPVLNSLFYALNSSYYARWYYMPVLILCGATASALSSPRLARAEIPRAFALVTAVTASSAAFALVPNSDADGNFVLGVVEEPLRFWGIFAVSMLGLLIFALVWWNYRRQAQRLAGVLLAAVLGFTVMYGTVHLSITKYGQWETDANLVAETYGSVDELNALLPDDGFYRIDSYESHNNLGLWLDKSCIQAFNSTVAPSILEFYPSVGVKRDVNSKPDVDLYGLRGLLSVRFTLVPLDSVEAWEEENAKGWTLYGETSRYAVYENNNWVPMGFAYDYYITEEQFESVPEKERGNLLMKALLLTEEQIAVYGGNLQPLPEEALKDRTYAAYQADCADRRADGVTAFTASNTGFTASCRYDREQLVLFSVPYDDGFTVTVNGIPGEVHQVDHGLIAVTVPGGTEVTVVCTYRTPGLDLSVRISLAAVAVYAACLAARWCRGRRKTEIQ